MGNDNSPLSDLMVKEIVTSLSESKKGILKLLENENADAKIKKKLTKHLIEIDEELLSIAYSIRKRRFDEKVLNLIRQEKTKECDDTKENRDDLAP